jgi:Fic family protein
MTIDVQGSPFSYYPTIQEKLDNLNRRVITMREVGKLSPQVLQRIQKYFRIKGIYHSNAIEGNSLTIGETRLVVERGLTLSGKTLRDQAEAKNLSEALDYMEQLVIDTHRPITLADIRQIHRLILKDIDDDNAGRYRTTEVRISGSDFIPTPHQY